ncbi:cytochrome c biogenesis CcdA family protein [Herminiimonas fonticola]|uniref:Cytochrome c biogenesis protein CcdA n=1 Tax=Herminiimonas fonticola TaxID=303380 RepID=A0A4V3BV40_9BURK|nr:cytochrome c biogenesis CcdA family protein [Herminiimonas fonticola]RBA23737.1 Cytochrome c biogenesis protein [Herminiimonas fonticola]TDN89738.1 cytochrome c biogenesis protein CcdA [Herminiimonas fonticola]
MNNLIELPFALLAGVLTIASPCVLPILPIVLGTSIKRASKLRPLFIVAGFVLTFAALGMLLASVSQSVAIAHETLRLAGIVILMLAGIAMLWRRPYEWLIAHLSGPLNRIGTSGGNAGSGNLGGFVLGMSLGAIWTPCAGPVLASILVLVTQAQNLGWSASLLILYAIGAGIPMLAIAYGGQFMTTRVRAVAKYAERLQKIFGALIVLTAIAIYFQYDVLIYAWISDLFPTLKGF